MVLNVKNMLILIVSMALMLAGLAIGTRIYLFESALQKAGSLAVARVYQSKWSPGVNIFCLGKTRVARTIYVRYPVDGQEVESQRTGCFSRRLSEKGREIDIIYNPSKPKQFMPSGGSIYFFTSSR